MNLLINEQSQRLIFIISGALTSSMLLITISPQHFFEAFFGMTLIHGSYSLETTVSAELILFLARSWSFLIFLLGASLLLSVFVSRVRLVSSLLAGLSKLFFVGLILFYSELVLPGFLLTLVVDAVFGLMLTLLGYHLLTQKA